MKKLLIVLFFLSLASGASVRTNIVERPENQVNQKLDSLNIKAKELNELIKKL